MEKGNCILVPVDFSEDSRIALEAADRHASREGRELIVLHVIPPWHPQESPDIPKGVQMFDEWMRRRTWTPSKRVAWLIREGIPTEKILQLAHDLEVCAIYMGRGGDMEQVGPAAAKVRAHFKGREELFSHLASQIIRRAA